MSSPGDEIRSAIAPLENKIESIGSRMESKFDTMVVKMDSFVERLIKVEVKDENREKEINVLFEKDRKRSEEFLAQDKKIYLIMVTIAVISGLVGGSAGQFLKGIIGL